MKNIQFTVQGMSCGHCVASVEKAISKIGATAKVDLASQHVHITFNEQVVSIEQLIEAIEEQGYEVLK
jgi:copper chaperone